MTVIREGLVNSYLIEIFLQRYNCITLARHALRRSTYHCSNKQLFLLALDLNSNCGQKIEANVAVELLP